MLNLTISELRLTPNERNMDSYQKMSKKQKTYSLKHIYPHQNPAQLTWMSLKRAKWQKPDP